MSRWMFWVVAALFVAGLVLAGLREGKAATLVHEGDPAPAFDLQKVTGGRAKLSDYAGKLVVLDFWATWCSPCREEMPFLVKIADEYKDKGVVFVAASEDDPDTAKADIAMLAESIHGLEAYAAINVPAVARAYKIEALPTMYFIGPDGKVIAGKRSMVSESYVRDMIEEHRPK